MAAVHTTDSAETGERLIAVAVILAGLCACQDGLTTAAADSALKADALCHAPLGAGTQSW
jgi:hypothetical protein